MNLKKQMRHFAPTALAISLALNTISPISVGVSSPASTQKDNAISVPPSGVYSQNEHSAFSKPQKPSFGFNSKKEFNNYLGHTLGHTIVSETSFLPAKTPPDKTQVMVFRMWLFVTAYSSTPDQTDDSPFITASGRRVRNGIVAANFLPIGTKVRFPNIYGDKIFVVEDRMNSRYYYRADIWMRTRWEAKQFGLRNTLIEIIREV